MLDAIAAVQRHSPMFLVGERGAARPCWMRDGGIYMSRTTMTPVEAEGLPKDPSRGDARWRGVVFFKGCADRGRHLPLVESWGDRCLDYGDFAVYGDHALLEEMRPILARAGFQTVREPHWPAAERVPLVRAAGADPGAR